MRQPKIAVTTTIEDSYQQLDTVNKHRAKLNIVLGDFNSKIERKEGPHNFAMGQYGYGDRNPRESTLI